jgi:hypothetical protein
VVHERDVGAVAIAALVQRHPQCVQDPVGAHVEGVLYFAFVNRCVQPPDRRLAVRLVDRQTNRQIADELFLSTKRRWQIGADP